MKINHKGFTIVELVLSFALISVIVIGMLTIIINYRSMIKLSNRKIELIQYKSTLTKTIQDDITNLGVRSIHYCKDASGNDINTCVVLTFKDESIKNLSYANFDVKNRYIQYGNQKFPIQESGQDDFESLSDATVHLPSERIGITLSSVKVLEDTVFKVRIPIIADDIDEDFGLFIVASDGIESFVLGNNEPTFYEKVAQEAKPLIDIMFNYTASGLNSNGEKTVDETNGIYGLEDEDGLSYFYRGVVDNLVQFGEYGSDYYVYRYVDDGVTHDFANLESCQKYVEIWEGETACTESNKTLLHAKGTPMYWKIVRVNGDGTIRLVYSGTTKDAMGLDTGIGYSMYNSSGVEAKYAGYTYDRATEEKNSIVKTVVDNWYTANLANTEFDSYIVEGKFCSDSSEFAEWNFGEEPAQMSTTPLVRVTSKMYTYRGFKNSVAFGFYGNNVEPTFKCPPTEQTYGGSYTLKAGLLTVDETIAAGTILGFGFHNDLYYLYNAICTWTMSPAVYIEYLEEEHKDESIATVSSLWPFATLFGFEEPDVVFVPISTVRPVINLKSDVIFKDGTDGSVNSPYLIDMTK